MVGGVYISAETAYRLDRKSPSIQPLHVASDISSHPGRHSPQNNLCNDLDLVVSLGNFVLINYIHKLEEFKRTIRVYKNHFWDFYNTQPKKVQDKLDWTIGLVRTLRIVPKIYFDHMTGTDGLWEIRTQVGSNIFRVFCCFDEGNLVILLSGFQKKTQKTPQNEIYKAEQLKKEYFDEKNK